MRIPRPSKRPWIAIAAVLAVAVVLLTTFHYGNANAGTGPPDTPGNPLAHLIVPNNEDPRIRLSWDAPDTPVSGYTITRTDGEEFQAAGSSTTYSDHSVEPGTTYAYSVMANSADGASPSSESASADVPDAPSAPGNLAGAVAEPESTDETATVNLTWLASTVPAPDQCDTAYPLTGYTIVRSDGDQETDLGTADAGATSFNDSTAAFSTNYTYRVAARNAIGDSTASETSVSVFSRPVLPPTGLMASMADPFDGNVSLSWDAPTEGATIVGYMVFRYLGADPYAGTDVPVTLDELATDTMLVDATAEAGVTYSYIVIARSEFNISLPSNIAAIEVPAPPTGLTATAGDGAIDLSWSAPAAGTVATYRVARRPQDGDWTTVADTAQTSHSDDTAEANIQYRYRVQHRNQHGGSAWAESGDVTMLSLPAAPGDASATVDGVDIVFTWSAPHSLSPTGYRLEYSIDNAAPHTETLSADVTAYRVTNAVDRATYRFRILGYNSGGDGPWSETASASVIQAPSAPRNVVAEAGADDITVTWEAPDVGTPDGYRVRHTETKAADWGPPQDVNDVTHYVHATSVEGVTYRYTIQAFNATGDSGWTEPVAAMRLNPPPPPHNVSATVQGDDIAVAWEAPADGVVEDYTVSYGEQNTAQPQEADVADGSNSFLHTGNTAGVTYEYRVKANNARGSSGWTQAVQATRYKATSAPAGLTAAARGQAIVLAWTAPDGDISNYQLRFSVVGQAWESPIDVNADETRWVHLTALGDTEYQYQVRSNNVAGSSPWSNTATGIWITPPQAPTSLAAVIAGDGLRLTWTAPTTGGAVDNYEIQHRAKGSNEWAEPWSVNGSLTTHDHTMPTPAQAYQYRARSRNDGGVSEWSPIADGIWYEEIAPPNFVKATKIGTRILIQWGRSASVTATGYDLRYRFDDQDWTTTSNSGRNRAAKLIDKPRNAATMDISVRTVQNDAQGEWIPATRYGLATPGPVSNLRVQPEGLNQVRIHWDEPTAGQPGRYRISSGTITAEISGDLRSQLRFEHPGAHTQYEVWAVSRIRNHGPRTSVDHTMRDTEHLDAHKERVTNPDAVMLDSQTVKVTWDHPTGANWNWDGTTWVITRDEVTLNNLNPNSAPPVIAYVRGATSYIDADVDADAIYRYRVTWDWPHNYRTRRSASVYAAPW